MPELSEDDEDASDDESPEGSGRRRPLWRELVVLTVTALVLTVLIQQFVARVYVIPSASMEQTLHGCNGCQNDRVLVDKITYRFLDVEPGEVVVFRGPDAWNNDFVSPRSSNAFVAALQGAASLLGLAPPNERDFVKRVIAVSGQTVECCDAEHRLLVDGKPLDEPYVYWQPGTSPANHEPFAPVRVPEGRLWVMGDNRTNSIDSRKQGGGGEAGTVPVANVIGKARVIVFPAARWSAVSDHNPQVVALGAPAAAGLLAAFPVLWVGRRIRKRIG
ncbi:signal peptidase I [Lentzea sp. NBRC 105346]|uniref:signal peptidase I n=1 Tax=Lentzea sp. NBRC 105346 TaxID=3032205 RepID=UPI0024A326B0|nr:signal peptidase I [Lentzea sp. NBRC 105346]GLZ31323.1 signal peptidase I [Lentzea sp. NBRC 105346]